jgi:hypothetical protein
MLNLLHNLHELRTLFPIPRANNIMMDSRVINFTFSSTTFIVVVLVINLIYHIHNLLINKAPTTRHTKGPTDNEVGYPLGNQMVKAIDFTI